MSARTIKRGFKRIGIAFAVPCLIVGAISAGYGVYGAMTLPDEHVVADGPDHRIFRFAKGTQKQQVIDALSIDYGRQLQEWEVVVYTNRLWQNQQIMNAWLIAGAGCLIGSVGFLISLAIGWIVAGFASEDL